MAASDEFEERVASDLRDLGMMAERVGNDSSYPDVRVMTPEGLEAYIEVKMDDAQFASPRFKYDIEWKGAGKKGSLYTDFVSDRLNVDHSAALFVHDLTSHTYESRTGNVLNCTGSCYPNFVITSAAPSSEKKDRRIVTLKEMGSFLGERTDSYIMKSEGVDITKIVAAHYVDGKSVPAHYLQFGDSFYRFDDDDPLLLGADVPVFNASGRVAVRVSIRSKRYEVLSEVKPKTYDGSQFSIISSSSKKNPFVERMNQCTPFILSDRLDS